VYETNRTVENKSIKGGFLREPSIHEILKNQRQDGEFLGFLTRSGWKGELPFYRFRCTIHGLVENNPLGYEKTLLCPLCARACYRITTKDVEETPYSFESNSDDLEYLVHPHKIA
jgi:hypothetical protein